jgi:hypothetical protein
MITNKENKERRKYIEQTFSHKIVVLEHAKRER